MGQTQGHELPYDIGERFNCLSSKTIWSVHAGKKKVGGEPVTVFVFDSTNRSEDEIKSAQSAHLRLKTLRHPNILKYIDGIELPTCIYVVTEESVPLETYTSTLDSSSNFSISWGLHQILKSLSFLNNDCKLVHRNICLSSVFVDEAGEWKLAGVEFMCPQSEISSAPPKTLEQLRKYDPPETSKPASARRAEKWSTDVWGCGCLVWEVFNGPLHQVSSLKNTSKIPKLLIPHYCEMVGANPKSRPNPSVLLDSLRAHEGYLANKFVSIALRIEEVQIMEPTQRSDFFNELNKNLDSFPESFAKHKILPQLINAFEFGGAGSSVLAPLFKLGGLLRMDQYQKMIVPCVVKLFSSTDRATRLNLLQQLEHLIDHLLPATVNDQIFPNIANGFSDTVPSMREQTVKATVLLAPKLSSSIVNGPLLKHLARCQLDEQPSIRTNTNICLGRIAGYLSPATRQKVLVTAFLRGLKDPYPPARIAAIGSMGATHALLCTSDISSRILPTLCTITVDKEKSVRDQAFQTIKFFLAKLEKISEDPQAAAEQEKIEASSTSWTSWTGWAMTSIASTFSKTPRSQATPTSNTGGDNKGTVEERQKEDAADPKDTTVRDSGATKGSGNQGGHRNEPLRKKSDTEDNWNDDEGWEDVNVGGEDQNKSWERGGGGGEMASKEDSDMEGWEDDGWGRFDDVPRTNIPGATAVKSASPQDQTMSDGGADFFDSISSGIPVNNSQGSKPLPPPHDPFETFGLSSNTKLGKSSARDRTPPVLTSASLFGGGGGGTKTGSKDNGGGAGAGGGWDEGEGDGWGDWNEDVEVKSSTKAQKTARASTAGAGVAQKTVASTAGAPIKQGIKSQPKEPEEGHPVSSTGWDSNWGTFDETNAVESQSRQEVMQNKREERRLKQQAAREKRAAGVKPGGLGAVKKD